MKKWTGHMRDWASKWFDLPPDVVNEVPRIEWIGNMRVRVENYDRVAELTGNKIVLHTSVGLLDVIGQRLWVKVIYQEVVIIEGEINYVGFRK